MAEMPIYQGIMGNTHVLAVDWSIEIEVAGLRARITIEKGFVFDGASIPRFLWRVCGHPLEVPRIAAALAHDWLYAAHVTDRETADEIYRAICEEVGIGWFRRSVEYRALRLFGGSEWDSHGEYDQLRARACGSFTTTQNEKENT